MEKPSIFSQKLMDLDFFKKMPKSVTKGSIFGLIMTIMCAVVVTILLINELVGFFSLEVESGMRIDHRKEDQFVEVHLAIDLPYFPCQLIGLDVSDYIGTHRLGDNEHLQYLALSPAGEVLQPVDMKMEVERTISEFKRARDAKEGCRVQGHFSVLMVPGNFHIAFHSKGEAVKALMDREGPFEADFTHVIHTLYFGTAKNHQVYPQLVRDFKLKSVTTLTGFRSETLVPARGPFTYKYKILIVPTDLIYEDKQEYEVFQYKTFWNIAMMEPYMNYMISVDYELSSLSLVETRKDKLWAIFLYISAGIIGGLIAFMSFIHTLVQKSVIHLIMKHGLGKLE
jgi:hypothetical protein